MLCRARLLDCKRPPLFSKIGPRWLAPPTDPVRFAFVSTVYLRLYRPHLRLAYCYTSQGQDVGKNRYLVFSTRQSESW